MTWTSARAQPPWPAGPRQRTCTPSSGWTHETGITDVTARRRFSHLAVAVFLGAAAAAASVAPSAGGAAAPSAAASAAADPRALKLIVSSDGPVVVTGADLARAGWDLANVDASALALSSAGVPHAFSLIGPAQGPLQPEHRIEFQGRAMTGLYTRRNVYWLHAQGGGIEPRSRDVTQVPGMQMSAWFLRTVHREQDTAYFVSMRASEGDDRWLWGEAFGPGGVREETFDVAGAAAEGPAPSLRIRLHGYTSDATVDPDHHVRLRVNGAMAAEARFDGVGTAVINADLPRRLLAEGENRLSIENVGDTGAAVDMMALNWFEVTYSAGFTADGDRLDFLAPRSGRLAYSVRRFSQSGIELYDVTDPAAPIRLTGASVLQDADGTYRLGFTDTAEEGTRYRAYTSAALMQADVIAANRPSSWSNPANGADYIAIVHPDFASALEPLLEYRRGQGLRTALVLIDDVYDEFSHGVFDPRAIRAFLQHAYRTWQPPAPTYVLLVGEASLDYRGGYGGGPANFVPSVQADVELPGELGTVTSDQWFANLEGPDDDIVPEVLIGRFPVSSAAQAATAVSKTLAYERGSHEPAASWRRSAIMVVDDDSATSFEAFSEQLIGLMGPHAVPQRFYAASYPRDRSLSADIRAAIEDGAKVVNFVGHGNVDLWGPWPGGGRIFQNADIELLTNGSRLPILTSATCMNGWIDHPRKPISMAELWLTKRGGGGVAAWSPSGYTMLAGQRRMMQSFYEGLFSSSAREEGATPARSGGSIGALVARAMAMMSDEGPAGRDIARMFVLVGDPALTVVDGSTASPSATPTPIVTPSSTATSDMPPPTRSPLYLPRLVRAGS